jgi:hypothetical protein
MTTELNRVETLLSAYGCGIGYQWAEDHVHAAGMSAQRNPVGNALIHLIDHQNHANLALCINLLAKELVRQQLCTDQESVDNAKDAIEWWLTQNCLNCHGTGVLNIEQHQCKVCLGTGKQPKPARLVRFVGVIDSSIEWTELQLRKALAY